MDIRLLTELVKAFAFSFVAVAGFSIVFNTEIKDVWWGSVFGSVGWVLYTVIAKYMGSAAGGYTAGAFTVAVFSEVAAMVLKRPATIFLVPSILPLVPGGGIYDMMFATVSGDLVKAGEAGYKTLIAAGAIALGIAVASSAARIFSKAIRSHIIRRQ
ncbi:threonine/serine exporter family protein [Treponema parvum]|uniref:Threonine/serine exporter family protein n=1 Tax=Treponema parvum TaxID=138851 RepID=A0A975F573_9SPIR|nr:threonine/serine exporter family protein [Treponema parvum]QTQ14508.1 threonine/serine exporter family protein [Treponema parvum]